MIVQNENFNGEKSTWKGTLKSFVWMIFFLYPLCIGSVNSWASGGYLLLVLFSLFLLISSGESLRSCRHELLVPLLLFFVALSLSFINADELYRSIKWLGKLAYFLFLIPVIVGLRRCQVNFLRPLGVGLLFAGFLAGGLAFYAHVLGGRGHNIGGQNPIIFGDLSMLVGVLIVCAVISGMFNRWLLWLTPFSIISTLFASVASGTRGGWLVVPVVIVFLSYMAWKIDQNGVFNRRRLSVFVVVVLLFFVALSPIVFPRAVGDQVDRTYKNLLSFSNGENLHTSTGIRLLLWDVSFKVWQEHPLFGSGMGDFVVDQKRLIEGKKTKLKKVLPHPHSIYFNFLSQTGLFGFVTMVVALLFLPFRIFYRSFTFAQTSEERFACLGGMSLVLCYAIFGLTEAVFSRSVFLASYAFFLSSFLASIPNNTHPEPVYAKSNS